MDSGFVYRLPFAAAVALPEPGSLALLLAGIAALGFVRRQATRGGEFRYQSTATP